MLFWKSFYSKSCLLGKTFSSKSRFLKLHVKRKMCAFYGINLVKTWFFVCKIFFQNLRSENNFFFRIVLLKKFLFFKIMPCKNNFFFKIWRIVKFLIRNPTRRTIFYLKIRCVVKFLIQNLLFKSSFQILAEFLSKCFQNQRTTCGKLTLAWGKTVFYECVACVCLTFGSIFLVIGFFMAIGFLMSVMIISFALPIYLYKCLWNSKNG